MSFAQSGLIKMMRVYCHSRSVTISVKNQIGLPICDSALIQVRTMELVFLQKLMTSPYSLNFKVFLDQASSRQRAQNGPSTHNSMSRNSSSTSLSLRFAAAAAASRRSSSSSSSSTAAASFDDFPRLEADLIQFCDKIMNCMLRYKDMR